MTPTDLLRRLLYELPEARVSDFRYRVNDCVNTLWRAYRWPDYITETAMSTTLSFSNLSSGPVGGGVRSYVSDNDTGGLFHQGHVGKTMTIDGSTYVVDEVVDGDNLYVTGSTTSGADLMGVSGSLPRVVLALPANFGRLYGRPYRTGQAWGLYGGRESWGDFLEEPRDYRLTGPVSDVYTIELNVVLGNAYTVVYLRVPTATTGMGSTLDVPDALEACLYQMLLKHYLRTVRARDEVALAQLQQRARAADIEYVQELSRVRALCGTRGERVGRNRPVGFGQDLSY